MSTNGPPSLAIEPRRVKGPLLVTDIPVRPYYRVVGADELRDALQRREERRRVRELQKTLADESASAVQRSRAAIELKGLEGSRQAVEC